VTGAVTVAVLVTEVPQPSVIFMVYAPWFRVVKMLLNVLAILLPWGRRIAAPGLISSKEKGPRAAAAGVMVMVPQAAVLQLAVMAVVNVGATEAATVTVVLACVLHTSVSRTV
jgi:hypothetical protein